MMRMLKRKIWVFIALMGLSLQASAHLLPMADYIQRWTISGVVTPFVNSIFPPQSIFLDPARNVVLQGKPIVRIDRIPGQGPASGDQITLFFDRGVVNSNAVRREVCIVPASVVRTTGLTASQIKKYIDDSKLTVACRLVDSQAQNSRMAGELDVLVLKWWEPLSGSFSFKQTGTPPAETRSGALSPARAIPSTIESKTLAWVRLEIYFEGGDHQSHSISSSVSVGLSSGNRNFQNNEFIFADCLISSMTQINTNLNNSELFSLLISKQIPSLECIGEAQFQTMQTRPSRQFLRPNYVDTIETVFRFTADRVILTY